LKTEAGPYPIPYPSA